MEQRLQKSGMQQVVGIAEGQILTGDGPHPGSPGSGSAAVLQVQHLKAGVPPGVCIAERSRAVGRAVVGQHTAELGETLGRDGVKTQGQVLCRVVDGHHHGNAGGPHASTSA